MKKKGYVIGAIISIFVGIVSYSYGQNSFQPGTAISQDVLVGKSFWSYDTENQVWILHNGVMANRDTLRITVPASAEARTLPAGYYSAIILTPESP